MKKTLKPTGHGLGNTTSVLLGYWWIAVNHVKEFQQILQFPLYNGGYKVWYAVRGSKNVCFNFVEFTIPRTDRGTFLLQSSGSIYFSHTLLRIYCRMTNTDSKTESRFIKMNLNEAGNIHKRMANSFPFSRL